MNFHGVITVVGIIIILFVIILMAIKIIKENGKLVRSRTSN